MIRVPAALLLSIAALVSAQNCQAHEGEEHHEAAVSSPVPSTTTVSEVPQRLANGDLYIPKSVQRLLGIRTEAFTPGSATTSIKIQGELTSRPESRAVVSASQTGTLEAPEDGWPLPGAAVKAGQILAYLRPQMTQREVAKRTAQGEEFAQRAEIDEINTERLRLQSSAGEGAISGNIYYEQARSELESAQQQRDAIVSSLSDRVPLRAAVSGVLLKNNQRSGEMVSAGQAVFEVTNPTLLRVTAYSFDPRLAAKVQSADLTLEGSRRVQLRLRGQEPLTGQPGWRLLFDVTEADTNLSPGMPVNVELKVATDSVAKQLAKACVIGQANAASVWLHVAPERFAQRRIASCDSSKLPTGASSTAAAFSAGDRLVIGGGALLAQYR